MTEGTSPGTPENRGAWAGVSAERQFLTMQGAGYASNDTDPEDLASAFEGECVFEIFRADEQRTSSTQFSGGDWRWRLITTDGVILAEAAGYPNEGLCRAAVLVLKRRAASAPVSPSEQPA